MTWSALAIFAGALLVAAASPGPGIAAIVARVLGKGTDGAVAFTAGAVVGDVVWLSFAVGGLAVLAQTFGAVFLAIKYAGAAYLLYLAYKLWAAPAAPQAIGADSRRESPLNVFLGGLSLTMGNPKAMMFYLALLPSLIDVKHVTWLGYGQLVAVTLLVLSAVFSGYIALAARTRRLFKSPRAMKLVNRGTGAVMAGAAVAVATR